MKQRQSVEDIKRDILAGIIPLMGSEGEGEGGGEGGNTGETNTDTSSSSNTETKNDDDKDPRIKRLSDENAAHRNRAKQAEQERDELRQRLEEFERKDKSELDNLKTDHQKAVEAAERYENLYKTTALKLAVMEVASNDPNLKFRNPATAARLVDDSLLSFGEDGRVEGVQDALKKLAESDPYLLASGSKDEGDGDGDAGGRQPSGGSTNGGRKHEEQKAQRAELERKYPALRGR